MPFNAEKTISCKPRRWISAAIIGILMLTILGCDPSIPPVNQIPPTQTNPSLPGSSTAQGLPGWLTVYFSDPNPPDNLDQGIDQYILPVLTGAAQTIDVTSFDLNLPSIVNALAAASQRGVRVRVVYDGVNGNLELENASTDYQTYDAIQVLKAGKVSLVDGGRSSGLMHDKMIIVDGKVLFMGSWNLSYNDTFRNNNNLLKITDPRLIANYQVKFNEMFVDKHFGPRAWAKVPNPGLTIDGVQVENYFAPEDKVMAKLTALVRQAAHSVHFMAYTFTPTDLSDAMIDRAKAGLRVQGVIEARDSDQGALTDLVCAGLPVKMDGNPYTMHHKVIIIDGSTVITGSFNFTKSADTVNDENVLVIHSPAVAALYEQEFQKIYGAGSIPTSADVKCSK